MRDPKRATLADVVCVVVVLIVLLLKSVHWGAVRPPHSRSARLPLFLGKKPETAAIKSSYTLDVASSLRGAAAETWAKAASRTSRPSSNCSSVTTRGTRMRMTLP